MCFNAAAAICAIIIYSFFLKPKGFGHFIHLHIPYMFFKPKGFGHFIHLHTSHYIHGELGTSGYRGATFRNGDPMSRAYRCTFGGTAVQTMPKSEILKPVVRNDRGGLSCFQGVRNMHYFIKWPRISEDTTT